MLICVGIIFYIAFFIVSIFLILIIGLLSLIHPIAGALAAFVLFIPLILLMYPLIFSGHYFMWKGLLGGSAPALPTSYETTLFRGMAKLEILATAGIFDGDVAEPRNVPARAEFLYAAAGGGLLWRCYFYTT